jgi:hypothetical protein
VDAERAPPSGRGGRALYLLDGERSKAGGRVGAHQQARQQRSQKEHPEREARRSLARKPCNASRLVPHRRLARQRPANICRVAVAALPDTRTSCFQKVIGRDSRWGPRRPSGVQGSILLPPVFSMRYQAWHVGAPALVHVYCDVLRLCHRR